MLGWGKKIIKGIRKGWSVNSLHWFVDDAHVWMQAITLPESAACRVHVHSHQCIERISLPTPFHIIAIVVHTVFFFKVALDWKLMSGR